MGFTVSQSDAHGSAGAEQDRADAVRQAGGGWHLCPLWVWKLVISACLCFVCLLLVLGGTDKV